MITTLNFTRDSFDQDNTFKFAFVGRRGEQTRTGYLFFAEDENQMYILQKGAMLKDKYTTKDYEEQARLNAQAPVRTGDVVEINGKQYTVKILGDYSDAGRLTPVIQ